MMPFIYQKSGITYVFSHNYAKIKVESHDSLPLEKALTLHNVIVFIISVFDRNQNPYYYNILLEKCSHQLPKTNGKKISFCINYKCYMITELTFLKKLMLIKQANQKSVIFITIGIF